MSSRLCKRCGARCCRYLALPIDKPARKRDFDDIRWFLLHKRVLVFVEDGDWYVQFTSRCRNLRADNRCAEYETRPAICRQYSTSECEYSDGDYAYEHLFRTPEELQTFAREFLRRKRARARRRRERQRKAPLRLARATQDPPPRSLPKRAAG